MSFRFIKSYLQNGMVVETRIKERYIFCNDRFMSVDNISISIPLSVYNNDLLLSNDNKKCDGDIVKVFSPVEYLSQVNTTNKIVWQRDVDIYRTKYIAINDLENFFGCKIKIVEE